LLLIVIDVRPPAFGEPVHKECLGTAPEKDDRPAAFRSSLPRPGDSLFDDPTTKVCVNLALFGPYNSLTQGRIRNPFLPGKALKPPGFEDSHKCASIHSIALSAIVQGLVLELRQRLAIDWFGAPHADFHVDARTGPVDDRHQATDSEPPEVRIADAREIGRRNAGSIVRGAQGKTIPIERLDDFGGEDGLEQLGIRVLVSEIPENIPAPPHHFQLFPFHRNISFSPFN